MSYLDEIDVKRQAARSRADSQQDIDSLIKELKEVQVASLLGNKQKPSIVLTDSSDLGEHISELGDKIIEVLEAVKTDKGAHLDDMTALMDDFKQTAQSLQASHDASSERIVSAIETLTGAMEKQKPIVVPAPAVSLEEKEVDFKPLIKEIRALVKQPAKEVDLSRFRAQQIDNRNEMQYILFTDTGDMWYILQNNTRDNVMGYVFGTGDYSQAWDDRYSNDYTSLREAVNAVRS